VHLHHWNTPPFLDLSDPEPVPSERLPRGLLRDKFTNLLSQVQTNLEVKPRSFRMGRFDAGPQVWGLLPEFGLEVDSSVVPLTLKGADVRQFLAPADPFLLDSPGLEGDRLLEIPVTMVPVLPGTPALIARLAAALPLTSSQRLQRSFRYVAAAGVQPAWYPFASMQLAARLHRHRGGQVLTMFFHSSELKPGASRLFPTENAVNRFVGKIRRFLKWLVQTGPVQGVTFSDLARDWDRMVKPGDVPSGS
jgi:hypothetical protein